jgi:bifunctional DNase/RNase
MLVVEGLGASLLRVVVTDLRDSVFYADLVLAVDGRQIHLSSRPSDAIALAVRARAPVFVAPAVLEEAGIEIEEEGDSKQEEAAVIEKFRQMLEDVTVEDFLE